ncbi:hypothetical protein [Corynebacterium vitaeruminis]|uniref:Uncharacterized protein n=1 Tax=Corynebacterium vitaeruminis DSM 20294 TaxID=1224164 RepID=W5XWT6_9CORY|nr:hypothetical protein [Corynebacterium vitaeruminis]AHI21476.1 hypothetical protein B843_00400 [Corynebacterium vitaeruminis DSM 20294]
MFSTHRFSARTRNAGVATMIFAATLAVTVPQAEAVETSTDAAASVVTVTTTSAPVLAPSRKDIEHSVA